MEQPRAASHSRARSDTECRTQCRVKEQDEKRTCDHDGLDVLTKHTSIIYRVACVSVTTTADEATTCCSPAVALCRLVAIALKVVVKLNLASRRDVARAEEPDLELALDNPLLGLAVGFAAVVDEASTVAFSAGVDHLQVSSWEHGSNKWCSTERLRCIQNGAIALDSRHWARRSSMPSMHAAFMCPCGSFTPPQPQLAWPPPRPSQLRLQQLQ